MKLALLPLAMWQKPLDEQKRQAIKLYKIWRESTPQAEMAFHLPDSFFFIRDLGKDRTVHPRAAWTGTAGLTHPFG